MFRDSTAANAAYAFAWVSPGNNVEFETRASNGTSSNYSVTVAAGGSPVWVRLLRSGVSNKQFEGLLPRDGVTWSQVGFTQTVTMATAALAGLAVTSHNQRTLNTSVLDNVLVSAVPTIVAAAWSTPSTDGGTNAQLTVLGTDPSGEANLTYTWTMTSGPAAVSPPQSPPMPLHDGGHLHQGWQLHIPSDDHKCRRGLRDQQRKRDRHSDVFRHKTIAGIAEPHERQHAAVHGHGPRSVRSNVFAPASHDLDARLQPGHAHQRRALHAALRQRLGSRPCLQRRLQRHGYGHVLLTGSMERRDKQFVGRQRQLEGLFHQRCPVRARSPRADGRYYLFAATTVAAVTLDGASPTLAGITFNNAALGYTIAQGTGGSITLQASTAPRFPSWRAATLSAVRCTLSATRSSMRCPELR